MGEAKQAKVTRVNLKVIGGAMVRRSGGVERGCPHTTCLLQPFGRAHSNRLGVPVMARLRHRMVRQLRRWCMVIWALDAVSADAPHCCPALLPTRVIAGH